LSDLHLDYAGELYDRTWALKDGSVRPEGIDLNYLVFRVPTLFRRMIKFREFPASEMSLSVQVISTANQGAAAPFVAIPVFPSRMFRHGFIFVDKSSRMKGPQDLEGKRIGLPDYTSTANIWVRGILQHELGVDLRKVEWVISTRPKVAISKSLTKHTRLTDSPPGVSLEALLEEGQIDAIISPEIPAGLKTGRVKRLLTNYKALEEEYFKKTGIFPIMHTVIMRRDVQEKERWVANSLYRAFEEAKASAAQRLEDMEFGVLPYSYAWIVNYHEEERKILGPDPLKYGLSENKALLGTFIDYCVEQHLIDRRPEAEELFEPSTI
jgi:4,5-dihydroxyphthalate decarboxylase